MSWFEKMLDGSATAHSFGSSQAATGKLTSRGSKSASDLRKKLVETYEEMERRVHESEATSTMLRNIPLAGAF